jgi:hypothetical protein
MMKTIPLLATAVGLLVLPLAAQQPGGMGGMKHGQEMMGMSGMMDSMMAPMMHAMAFAPEHLLAAKATLRLTSDQETRLTALRDATKPAHDAAAQQAMMHLREMADVMRVAAPDTSAVRHHFDAALRFMGDAHWAMLSAAAQARGMLTDAQRQRADATADSMPAHPMMQGGMRHP